MLIQILQQTEPFISDYSFTCWTLPPIGVFLFTTVLGNYLRMTFPDQEDQEIYDLVKGMYKQHSSLIKKANRYQTKLNGLKGKIKKGQKLSASTYKKYNDLKGKSRFINNKLFYLTQVLELNLTKDQMVELNKPVLPYDTFKQYLIATLR